MSDQLLPHEPFELSPGGQARSEAILARLQGRLGRAVAKQKTARRAAAAASVLIIAGLSAWAIWPRPAAVAPRVTPPLVRHDQTPEVPEAAPVQPVRVAKDNRPPEHRSYVRVVSTQSGSIAACASRPTATPAPVACELSDRQLLSALAETGSNFGLIRVNGRTVVVKDGRPMSEQGG